MKNLILLFAALLVAGCGEKSSPEGSDSAGESAEPSADAAKQVPTKSPGKEPSSPSLSDADVERLLKKAVDSESLPERDGLIYHDNKPYSGWGKEMYDSGQASRLACIKDGKPDGLVIEWYSTGQKSVEANFKDGEPHGLVKVWHENGQTAGEVTVKDGEEVSAKYWNNKGEEVETEEEAFK